MLIKEKKTKLFQNLTFKEVNEDDRTFTAIITGSNLDADKEVVLHEGVDFKEFIQKRKGLFFNHDHSIKIGEIDTIRKSGANLTAKGRIFKTDGEKEGNRFLDIIDYAWFIIKKSTKTGLSIGFEILETRLPTKKDLKDFGKDVKNIITRSKIFEVSLAMLQSNPDALITSFKDYNLSNETISKFFPDIELEKKEIVNIELETKELATIKLEIKKRATISLLKKRGAIYY